MTAAYLTATTVVRRLGGVVDPRWCPTSLAATATAPPFRVLGKEAGIIAAGAGGLIGTWAGLDSLGSAIVAIVGWAVLMLALYAAVLPYLRRRRERRDRAGYIGLGGTVTRDVLAGDFGEVSFVDNDGNRVRLPAKSSAAAALPKSTRVYITAVDDEFVHVSSAREL